MSDTAKARKSALAKINDEILALKNSPLYLYRTENNYFPVIGEGSHFAEYMFVGEAPGRNEAKLGIPFCGAAGKILDSLLETRGLKRENVYITSIVKDRPPKNRDPSPEEILIYGPFLDRQIEIIKPNTIITLGRYSMDYIMKKFDLDVDIQPISKAHGRSYRATASYGPIRIVIQYHPAAAIYNQSLVNILKKDFKVI